ncbi:hypothetical protein BMW23_1188 [Bodo saltans virus]|uniref:Uncharacterized protein n=1 Tax=Bodo saltans virus TaxID=2024608 RepID=A0A2H4UWC2_9VIRU|nr:hypothetical protein QJ851_gp1168 [Bodo saltans virus]ATZ81231.1 hypothetical protein BMW23_1188 [Bodo saltans virus]
MDFIDIDIEFYLQEKRTIIQKKLEKLLEDTTIQRDDVVSFFRGKLEKQLKDVTTMLKKVETSYISVRRMSSFIHLIKTYRLIEDYCKRFDKSSDEIFYQKTYRLIEDYCKRRRCGKRRCRKCGSFK